MLHTKTALHGAIASITENRRCENKFRFHIRPVRVQQSWSKTEISASKRKARDPDQYASYDALREDLHADESSSGFISSALNFISQTAFGDLKREDKGGGGRTYRSLLDSKWATELLSNLTTRPGYKHDEGADRCAIEAAEAEDDIQSLARRSAPVNQPQSGSQGLEMLLGCNAGSVAAVAQRWPPLLDMDLAALQKRLLMLKEELPRVDVTDMVRQHPRAFLAGDLDKLHAIVSANVRVLQEGLEGADIDAMAEEDPLLLLQDPVLLEEGIKQTRQLWDVDAAAFADSDPWKLALAVRAMTRSSNALPHRF